MTASRMIKITQCAEALTITFMPTTEERAVTDQEFELALTDTCDALVLVEQVAHQVHHLRWSEPKPSVRGRRSFSSAR